MSDSGWADLTFYTRILPYLLPALRVPAVFPARRHVGNPTVHLSSGEAEYVQPCPYAVVRL